MWNIEGYFVKDYLGGKRNFFQVKFVVIFLFWFRRGSLILFMIMRVLFVVFKGEQKWVSFMLNYININI